MTLSPISTGAKMTPIEALFWDAAHRNSKAHLSVSPSKPHSICSFSDDVLARPGDLVVGHQVPVARYKVDFVLTRWPGMSRQPYVFVECDGHDYHERTKEQAAYDRSKDRFFQGLAPILRFTGSELWRDADRCWLDAVEFLDDHAEDRTHRAVWEKIDLLITYLCYEPNVSEEACRLGTDLLLALGRTKRNPPIVKLATDEIAEFGVNEGNFQRVMGEIGLFFSCRSMDTDGRFVFRLANGWRLE